LNRPSDMQRKAICHVAGPARVLAGPGSGKTFTIIQRISYLVNVIKIPPEQILCITYTKAAAKEMQSRYQVLKNTEAGQNCTVHFKTIHGICYQILKESGEYRNFSLINEQNKRKIIETILKNKGLIKEFINGASSDMLDAISRKKNALLYISDSSIKEELFETIYDEYQMMLQQRKLLDYDDMVSESYKIFITNNYYLNKWQRRFDYILVDEFQDVNLLQYNVIKLLAMPQNNLYVVGDDDQAIYGFRGAMPAIMQTFSNDFPDVKELLLTENYRSGSEIVDFAGKIIQKNRQRIDKKILSKKTGGNVSIIMKDTEGEESTKLVEDINKLTDEERKNSAIILRTNREVVRYKALLAEKKIKIKEDIPRKKSLLLHFAVQDIMAFLSFCKGGYKRCDFLKIMNKPEIYLSEHALMSEKVSEGELLQYYSMNSEMQERIKKLFIHYKRIENLHVQLAVQYIRNVMGYDEYLKKKICNQYEYEKCITRMEEFCEMAKEYREGEKIEEFFKRLETVCISTPADSTARKRTGISVITMHSAKGLEFDAVFLPDLNEGVMPGRQCNTPDEIEEERRLLYVSVTRAKKYLIIYCTKERRRKPSRFIADFIPHQ